MKTLVLATLSLTLAATASADVHVLNASLDGAQEVPPVATAGVGEACITVDDVTGLVHVQGTATGLSGAIQMAHLHGLADVGSNAGVLFGLSVNGNSYEGSSTLSPAQVAGILDGRSYVNLHTSSFPGGEVRGQGLFDVLTYTGVLDGAQSGNGSAGTGTYTVNIDRNTNDVSITGTYQNLQGNVTASHLHGPAWFGQGGGVVFGLSNSSGMSGTFQGTATLTDSEVDDVIDGFTYINIHTTMFPGGEIRGQVNSDFLGTPYCKAQDNSTGSPGSLLAAGSIRAMDNDVTVFASGLPQMAFGYVITSQSAGQTFPVTNSQGRICVVGPNIGRIGSTIQSTGMTGNMSSMIDISNIPGNPPQSAMAGDTFNFQIWHRDASGGMATSNFTNAVSISFR